MQRVSELGWTIAALAIRAGIASADDGGAGPLVRWERPPEGTLERGLLGVPEWVVIVVGALVVAAAGAALVVSMRRAAKRAR